MNTCYVEVEFHFLVEVARIEVDSRMDSELVVEEEELDHQQHQKLLEFFVGLVDLQCSSLTLLGRERRLVEDGRREEFWLVRVRLRLETVRGRMGTENKEGEKRWSEV